MVHVSLNMPRQTGCNKTLGASWLRHLRRWCWLWLHHWNWNAIFLQQRRRKSGSAIVSINRSTVVAEFNDIYRKRFETFRPLFRQRLRRSDRCVSVVNSFLVAVHSQQSDVWPWVGDDGELVPPVGEVDVPLFPERPLAAVLPLADEPFRRQESVDQRLERRVQGVEPVLKLTPAGRSRRKAPCTDDLDKYIRIAVAWSKCLRSIKQLNYLFNFGLVHPAKSQKLTIDVNTWIASSNYKHFSLYNVIILL